MMIAYTIKMQAVIKTLEPYILSKESNLSSIVVIKEINCSISKIVQGIKGGGCYLP